MVVPFDGLADDGDGVLEDDEGAVDEPELDELPDSFEVDVGVDELSFFADSL